MPSATLPTVPTTIASASPRRSTTFFSTRDSAMARVAANATHAVVRRTRHERFIVASRARIPRRGDLRIAGSDLPWRSGVVAGVPAAAAGAEHVPESLAGGGTAHVVDRRRRKIVAEAIGRRGGEISAARPERLQAAAHDVVAGRGRATADHVSRAAPPASSCASTTDGVPVGTAALSTVPSQLSSTPLHVSVLGVPGAQLSLKTPNSQLAIPVARAGPHAAGRHVVYELLVDEAVAVVVEAVAGARRARADGRRGSVSSQSVLFTT